VTALTVTSEAAIASVADAVLASLPVSFAAATDPAADVEVLRGGPGWAERASAHLGAGRSVLVTSPAPLRADDHRTAPELDGSRLVLDLPWSGSPALPHAATHLRAVAEGADLLEVHATIAGDDELGTALLDIALTVRALLAPLDGARLLSTGPGGTALLATAGALDVSIQITRTAAVRSDAQLRVVGPVGTAEILRSPHRTSRRGGRDHRGRPVHAPHPLGVQSPRRLATTGLPHPGDAEPRPRALPRGAARPLRRPAPDHSLTAAPHPSTMSQPPG
jgi:hypothetical protein